MVSALKANLSIVPYTHCYNAWQLSNTFKIRTNYRQFILPVLLCMKWSTAYIKNGKCKYY